MRAIVANSKTIAIEIQMADGEVRIIAGVIGVRTIAEPTRGVLWRDILPDAKPRSRSGRPN